MDAPAQQAPLLLHLEDGRAFTVARTAGTRMASGGRVAGEAAEAPHTSTKCIFCVNRGFLRADNVLVGAGGVRGEFGGWCRSGRGRSVIGRQQRRLQRGRGMAGCPGGRRGGRGGEAGGWSVVNYYSRIRALLVGGVR